MVEQTREYREHTYYRFTIALVGMMENRSLIQAIYPYGLIVFRLAAIIPWLPLAINRFMNTSRASTQLNFNYSRTILL